MPTVWYFYTLADTKQMKRFRKELYGLCIVIIIHDIKNYARETGMCILYAGRLRMVMCEVFKVVNDIGLVYLKQTWGDCIGKVIDLRLQLLCIYMITITIVISF